MALAARQTPAVRDRQGRRRQVDGRDRARDCSPRGGGCARSWPSWPARSASRGCFPTARASSFASSSSRRGCSRSRSIPSRRWRSTCASRPGRSARRSARAALFHAFAMATPGMRELLSIGKVWELAQLDRRTRGAAPYDLVIVDAPATGHGVGPAAHAADVRRDRPGRADRPPGPARSPRRSPTAEFTGVIAVSHAGGDAGQRDAVARRRAGPRRARARPRGRQRALPGRFEPAEIDELNGALGRDAVGAGALGAARGAVRARARRPPSASSGTVLPTHVSARLVELPYVFADHSGCPRSSSWPTRSRRRSAFRRASRERRRDARGQARMRLRRLGRRRQDDHFGGDRARDGRARRQGRGGDDRPGQPAGRRARAARSSRTSPVASSPPGWPATDLEVKGELWAMMLDPKRTFDELIDRIAPDPGAGARRSRPTASIASCRPRSRARRSSPRSPSSTSSSRRAKFDVLVLDTPPSRNALEFLDAPGRLNSFLEGRALKAFLRPTGFGMRVLGRGALPLLLGAAPDHGHRPDQRPVDVLPAARRHDRRLQPARRPGRARCSAPTRPHSCSSPRPRASRSTRRSGSAARSRPTACRSPAWSSTASITICSAIARRTRSGARWPGSCRPALAVRVRTNFRDYHVLAQRDDHNLARLARRARRRAGCCSSPNSTTTSTTSPGCCASTATCLRRNPNETAWWRTWWPDVRPMAIEVAYTRLHRHSLTTRALA